MSEKSKIITLVSTENARKGYKFVFEEYYDNRCKTCPLYNVCVGNLEPGRVYEIVNVRRKKHKCQVYKTEVVVVEVKEAPIEALIRTSLAIEGVITTYAPIECNKVSCKYYELCKPTGLKGGDKCKILKVYGKVKCDKGGSLTRVLLNRI